MKRLLFPCLWLLASIGSAAGCSVDETGYLVPPKIHYSSPDPLSGVRSTGFVVGTEGAIATPGGQLTVENVSSKKSIDQDIEGATGSFVVEIGLQVGDELHLGYAHEDGNDELTISVDDPLDQIVKPEMCLICTGLLVSPPDASGTVQVGLGALEKPAPPYVVFHRQSDECLLVSAIDQPVSLSAKSGDEVCVFRVLDQSASAALCASVP